jgi:predicted TIM-barrel fold metal-dependent hydrolase
VSQPFEYCTNIINLIFGGMMVVFPEFRFAFLEAGAEFAVVLKHRIEENLEQIGYLREMLPYPLEWYFDRFYFLVDDRMLENDGKLLRPVKEELGVDHLFFGSDYPHSDGHLDTSTRIRELTWLTEEEKEAILGKNVQTLMGGGSV